MTQNFQISKRLDDGTILVIGGEDWGAFTNNVVQAIQYDMDQQAIFEAFNHLASIPGVTGQAISNLNQGGIPAAQYVQPPTAVQPPPPVAPVGPPEAAAPVCQHGPKRLYHGTAKSGRNIGQPYSAWMCPAPKGTPDQCKPQYL